MTEIGHKTQFSIWQMTFNIQQHRRDVFYKEPCNTSNNWWNIIEPGLPKSTLKVMWLLQAHPTGLDMVMKVTQHNTTPGIPGPAAVLLLLSAWLCSKTWEPAVVLPRPVLWDMGTLRTHLTILPPLRRCRTEDGPWGRYARRVVVRYIVTNFSCGVDLLLARRAIEVILKGLSTILPLDPSPYHTLPYHTMPCTYHPFALLFLGPNMICTLRQPIVSINNNFIW